MNKNLKTKYKSLDKDITKAIDNKNLIQSKVVEPKVKKYSEIYNKLVGKFKINEKFTKIHQKVAYDKFKAGLPPLANYNFMADIIMLPETEIGKFKYLLVVLDLWSNKFDCEPLKTKEAKESLKAIKKMFNSGKYIKKPYASISTDNGGEFKAEFDQYLHENNIFHKWAQPYNHKQQGPVENLNKLLGRFLIGYLNKKENETGKTYNNWTDILPQLKKELNKIRTVKDENPFTYWHPVPTQKIPKFKIGDVVYHRLRRPINSLGEIVNGGFRTGDLRWSVFTPRKITKILFYPVNIRYLLEDIPNVSFTEDEIMIADNEKESKYIINKIIDKKIVNGKIFYLVFWKYFLKSQASWEPKEMLIEDNCLDAINDYEKSIKNKKKK